jgi:diguanylate cyclase (GGDEF)-like protein/PAS domain S-box-containing protein
MLGDDGFYKAVLDNLYDGVYFVDRDRRIRYWNLGAERITGYPSAAVVGQRCADNLLVHVDGEGRELCRHGCPLARAMEDGGTHEAQVFLHHASGHRVPVSVRIAPLRDAAGNIVGAVEVFNESSALLHTQQRVDELTRAAEEDALTGVGNRRHGELQLAAALTECSVHGRCSGLLFLDVDHFKQVNDRFGHAAGDRVLRMVADTLRHNVRATDTVARWGGEEFLVLIPRVDPRGLSGIADKLRMLVAASHLKSGGAQLRVTVSIGGTMTRPGDTVETLLARADESLYRSKSEGRDRTSIAA